MEIRYKYLFFLVFPNKIAKLKNSILFFLVALILNYIPAQSFAQDSTDTDKNSYPAVRYIEKVDTIISVKLNVNTEFEQF